MNLVRILRDFCDAVVRLTGLIHRAADAVEAQLPVPPGEVVEHNGEPAERRLPAGKKGR